MQGQDCRVISSAALTGSRFWPRIFPSQPLCGIAPSHQLQQLDVLHQRMALPLTRADALLARRNSEVWGTTPSSLEEWSNSPAGPNGPDQTVRELGDARAQTRESGGADLPEVVKQVLGARLEREVADVELRVAAAAATAWARLISTNSIARPRSCAAALVLFSFSPRLCARADLHSCLLIQGAVPPHSRGTLSGGVGVTTTRRGAGARARACYTWWGVHQLMSATGHGDPTSGGIPCITRRAGKVQGQSASEAAAQINRSGSKSARICRCMHV